MRGDSDINNLFPPHVFYPNASQTRRKMSLGTGHTSFSHRNMPKILPTLLDRHMRIQYASAVRPMAWPHTACVLCEVMYVKTSTHTRSMHAARAEGYDGAVFMHSQTIRSTSIRADLGLFLSHSAWTWCWVKHYACAGPQFYELCMWKYTSHALLLGDPQKIYEGELFRAVWPLRNPFPTHSEESIMCRGKICALSFLGKSIRGFSRGFNFYHTCQPSRWTDAWDEFILQAQYLRKEQRVNRKYISRFLKDPSSSYSKIKLMQTLLRFANINNFFVCN